MTWLIILLTYAALMIGYGFVVSRRVKESGDFFVAGRNLGAGLIFSTLLAANIGAGSTVGAAGFGYRDGLSAWWWVGSAGIGSLILAFTVGPKIWRVAREQNLYTVGDYLEFRYSRSVRGLMAIFLWFGALAILAGQLIALAWILNVIANVDKAVGCLIGAAVTTFYFTLGGLQGTVRVNVFQLVVKMLGFGLAIGYLILFPPQNFQANGFCLICPGNSDAYHSLSGIGAARLAQLMAILIPAFVISPGLLQKIFGARDERAVKIGVGLNAAGLLLFAIVPVTMGMIARAQFPELGNHELALPTLLTSALPVWLGGLLLGAIFAAELSTADAVLFMLTTSLSKDLYKTFIRPQASDEQLMQVARETAVICGTLGALLGILLPDVLSALTIFYTLLVAALLLPLVVGLYSTRVTARAALLTILASVTATFLSWLLTADHQGLWGVPPIICGIAAGAMVMMANLKFETRATRIGTNDSATEDTETEGKEASR
jgi:SSS family solute:Na+ symporter